MTYIDDIIDGTIGSLNFVKTIDGRKHLINLEMSNPSKRLIC